MTPLRGRMIHDMTLRGFSENTKASYLSSVIGLARHYRRSPEQISAKEVQDYLIYLHQEKGLSWRSCNCARHAIRFLYRITLGRPDPHFYLPGAKTPSTLPEILNNDELVRLFTVTTNPKHRAILMTAYAAGLAQLAEHQPLTLGDEVRILAGLPPSQARECALRPPTCTTEETTRMTSTSPRVVTFEDNTIGRDFVCGDIHGCFSTLHQALAQLGYNPSRDRLFSVGDLIDHGTGSEAALEWMQSRFTAVVRGNHEQMMLEWLWHGARFRSDAAAWRTHWSSWWFPSSQPREARVAWARALCALPLAATIETAGGPVGLVHGAVTGEHWGRWRDLVATLEASGREDNPTHVDASALGALWERATERHRTPGETNRPGLDGVALTIHGHDPGPTAGWTARTTLCIDTGVHWPELGHLTVAEIQAGKPALHRFARAAEDALLEPPPRPAGLWDHAQGVNAEAFVAAMGTREHPTALQAEWRAGTLTL